MTTLRLATWNINSVRLRIDLVKRFAEEENPDIICLQETKTPDEAFPIDAVRQMGYTHTAFAGQKGYNGVAILSKLPLTQVCADNFMERTGNGDKRHMKAVLPNGWELHNFYVPAGGDIPDPALNPKFAFKLEFLKVMQDYFAQPQFNSKRAILVGDLNIAPGEHDVWSHKQLLKIVSHTPVEVEELAKVYATQGWVDSARIGVADTQKIYSWWSYRSADWNGADKGRRLDHVWLHPSLHEQFAGTRHLRHIRGWEQPSDHVPVVVDIRYEP